MSALPIYGKLTGTDTGKPWLVMVHGFVQNHKIFNAQEDFFKNRFNILLVDLRGHGKSSEAGPPYSPEEYADDLELLLGYHNIENFYYWGTHTGTGIGMIYALRHPGQVLGFVQEGCVLPGYPMPRVDELIARARKIAAEQSVEAAREDWFEAADWYAYMAANRTPCRAEEHKKIVMEFEGRPWLSAPSSRPLTNVDARLAELTMPLLLYNGRYDMPDFYRVAERVRSQIPSAVHEIIPDAGGFPGWENPKAVNEVVSRFFNQIVK
jgi:pimeloyl-ACP methyl ester carboxylesterase